MKTVHLKILTTLTLITLSFLLFQQTTGQLQIYTNTLNTAIDYKQAAFILLTTFIIKITN